MKKETLLMFRDYCFRNDDNNQDSGEESIPNVSLDDIETFTRGEENDFEEK